MFLRMGKMKNVIKVLLIILLIIVGILAYPVVSYLLWQKEFESKTPQMDCSSNLSELISLDEKSKKFVLSEDKVTFIEFSIDEVLSLLKSTNIINGGEIHNICIVPNNGFWNIYVNLSLQGIRFPWVRLEIAKDSMETAQLYAENIYIGEQLMPESMSANIKTGLNKGISDAIVLVNENNFLGRKIQNIELLQDKIVVKGSL